MKNCFILRDLGSKCEPECVIMTEKNKEDIIKIISEVKQMDGYTLDDLSAKLPNAEIIIMDNIFW